MENSMLKDAIAEIASMEANGCGRFEEVDGNNYFIDKNNYEEVLPSIKKRDITRVHGLDHFCDLIKFDDTKRDDLPLFVSISDEKSVTAYYPDQETEDGRHYSEVLYEVKDNISAGFSSGYHPYTEAQIMLRSQFVQNEGTEYILKMISSIAKGDQAEIKDDGITQQVKVETGLQLFENENVQPIQTLTPYRTFPEVEQPSSEFLFRIRENEIGLFEADGGMWKLQAKINIQNFLKEALSEEIAAGAVILGR